MGLCSVMVPWADSGDECDCHSSYPYDEHETRECDGICGGGLSGRRRHPVAEMTRTEALEWFCDPCLCSCATDIADAQEQGRERDARREPAE